MVKEKIIKKAFKKMKEKYPGLAVERLEKELIPLSGEEVQPRVGKKKKKD